MWKDGGTECDRIEIPAVLSVRIEPAFLEEECRQVGDYWTVR